MPATRSSAWQTAHLGMRYAGTAQWTGSERKDTRHRASTGGYPQCDLLGARERDSCMQEQGGHPAALYKGIPIYLFKQEGMELGEYAAHIECYGRVTPIKIQGRHYPTRTNLRKRSRHGH
jgi:hypothetical protein